MADAAVAEWRAVAEALAPTIGRSSVTALYRRCLLAVAVERTWLPNGAIDDPYADDWRMLHAALSHQTLDAASDACTALSLEFRDLLGSLIGPSLTEQLMRPVSALPSTISADQDRFP